MKTNSKPALEWGQTIPRDRWVKVRSSSQGIYDLVKEFNTRDNRDIRVRVTPAPEMGWVKVKQIP